MQNEWLLHSLSCFGGFDSASLHLTQPNTCASAAACAFAHCCSSRFSSDTAAVASAMSCTRKADDDDDDDEEEEDEAEEADEAETRAAATRALVSAGRRRETRARCNAMTATDCASASDAARDRNATTRTWAAATRANKSA